MRLTQLVIPMAVCALALAPTLPAQRPTALKGIWEPVNYSEDIALNDVFFITPEIGWVAGNAGTILYTRDGGATWTAQLGGDPGAQDPPIQWIRFIDAKHGWAGQHYGLLLRTTDGETWQRIGSHVPGSVAFLSPTSGFHAYGGRIYRTRDAGRTWQEVFTCRAKLQVAGLARDVSCNLSTLHFPSRDVGYAVGDARIVAKTVDGGEHWSVVVSPEEAGDQRAWGLVFLDETTGIAGRWSGIYRTTDGGATWDGVSASVATKLSFADPEVGWAFWTHANGLSYTTDGGRRWTARTVAFPAQVISLSVPRRDRVYVVGEHGMIYRYRVVPAGEPTQARAIVAPALPAFDSPLDDKVADVAAAVDVLKDSVTTAADSASGDASDAPLVDNCCAASVNKLQATLDALTPLVPQFLGKYRNVNLVIAGLRWAGLLPDQLAGVRRKLGALRKARGAPAAAAALADVATAVQALKQTTAQAFETAPPTAADGGGAAPEAEDASAAAEDADSSAAASDSSAPDTTTRRAQKAATPKAKASLKKAIKRKVKFP